MTVKEVLAHLKSLRNDARRKHNTKNGAPDNQFGVPLGDIRAVANNVKADHAFALKLRDTGNVDAQLLAALIVRAVPGVRKAVRGNSPCEGVKDPKEG